MMHGPVPALGVVLRARRTVNEVPPPERALLASTMSNGLAGHDEVASWSASQWHDHRLPGSKTWTLAELWKSWSPSKSQNARRAST